MTPRVISAQHIRDFIIHIQFADGQQGEVDLGSELHGEIFEPLRELAFFTKFQVHSELGTLTWPNGADFAPEFLYARVRVPA